MNQKKFCVFPQCRAETPRTDLFCQRHWEKVPQHIRRNLASAFRAYTKVSITDKAFDLTRADYHGMIFEACEAINAVLKDRPRLVMVKDLSLARSIED